MKDLPKQFCRYCGTLLETSVWYGAYNNDTGERYSGPKYSCPKKRWYEFWHQVFYTGSYC